MSTRKLRRTPHDKMVAGVCGGIAEYFGVDATLIRVAYVILGVMSTGFPALLVYLILAFVMPER
ncbi:MAG: PspC domain-containing protein [Bacteroidetes bacterium]|jgi:phage shock protein C|nr:PspC domain-containing protein [Bacteroidota bacterium]